MDEAERLMFEGWSRTRQFKKKIDQARSTIAEALTLVDINEQLVAISWGKDSVVMLHLIQEQYPDILAVFAAGYWMESFDNFLEVQSKYCELFNPNLIVIDETEEQAFAKRTMPTPKRVMSEIPHKLVYMGLRKDESPHRKRTIVKNGLIHHYSSTDRYRVCPIGHWTTNDVWAYIVSRNLPYLNSYDKTDKHSMENRTTAHLRPFQSNTRFGSMVRAQVSLHSLEFRNLLNEFSDYGIKK